MKARIVLVAGNSWNPMSAAIMWATGSEYSHAMIHHRGNLWDASESRGSFDQADALKYQGRKLLVIEFNDYRNELGKFIKSQIGKDYDWSGVLGWLSCRLIKKLCGRDDAFYCFEAAFEAMTISKHSVRTPLAVSARDLLRYAKRNNLRVCPNAFINERGRLEANSWIQGKTL